MGDFPYAEWLARHYKDKGETTGFWADYLKAHGLANFSVAKDPTIERCKLVYEIEDSWYGHKHPQTYTEHQQLTNIHRRLLDAYREQTKEDFAGLDGESKTLDFEDIFSEANLDRLSTFSSKLFRVSQKCSSNFVCMSQTIIASSVETLAQFGMAPPCDFAAIALGSVAKGEATPYSDLEYAFIVERDEEYFTMLAVDTYFKIGNLCETPLKCFDIDEITSAKKCGVVLVEESRIGYRIDGISKSAGNIPTGSPEGQRLTLTVDGFMDLYRTSAEAPFEGIAGDKSDMISSSLLIYTNEVPTPLLHERLLQTILTYETTVALQNSSVAWKRLQSFSHDVDRYNFLPNFTTYHGPNNVGVKVKADIFRYPTLLANNIRMCLGFGVCPPWSTFERLHNEGLLSADNHLYISTVLALAIHIRTSAYMQLETQSELLSLYSSTYKYTKDRYHVPLNLFVIMGYLLIPLKQTIASNINTCVQILGAATNLNGLIERMVSTLHLNKDDFIVKVEVLHFADDRVSALKELSKGIGRPVEEIDCAVYIDILREKGYGDSERKCLMLCSSLIHSVRNYMLAAEYYMCLVTYEQSPVDIAFWKTISGDCLTHMCKFDGAKLLLNEALAMLKEEVGLEPQQSLREYVVTLLETEVDSPLSDTELMICMTTASAYQHLGELYSENQMIEKAIAALEDAITMRQLFSKHHQSNVSGLLTSLGMAYRAICNYRKALQCLFNALNIQHALYGTDTNHPNILALYDNLGSMYKDIGEYSTALSYHNKAMNMAKVVYGANTNHPDIVCSYSNIAIIHYLMGNYTASIEQLLQAVAMNDALYNAGINNRSIATNYNNIACAYENLGDTNRSLTYHKRSLKIRKALYGSSSNHPEIALSYNNIGCLYRGKGDNSTALEYLTKSLDIGKAIYVGTDSNLSSLAIKYSNVALLYNDLGEHKKSIEYQLTALDMTKSVHGAETIHSDIAICYGLIGRLYRDMGKYVSSLEYYEKSLDMNLKLYGSDSNHPIIAGNYNSLGELYNTLGNYKQALHYHEKALTIREAIHGVTTNYVEKAIALNNIGKASYDIDNYSNALRYYTKALDVRKQIPEHPAWDTFVATLTNNIGAVYNAMGEFTVALHYYTQALDMRKAIHSESNHAEMANSYTNLGNLYCKMEQFVPALEYLTKSLTMQAALHANIAHHSDIVGCYSDLGEVYRKHGDFGNAFLCYQQAVVMNQCVNRRTYITVLYRIAQVWYEMSEYMVAYKFLKLVFQDTTRAFKADIAFLMGRSCLKLGNWSKSRDYLQTALCSYETLPSCKQSTYRLAKVHYDIALLNFHLGDLSESLEHCLSSQHLMSVLLADYQNPTKSWRNLSGEISSLTETLKLIKRLV